MTHHDSTPAKTESEATFAAARGSLSGLSVKKLLSEWAKQAGEWREHEKEWGRSLNADTYTAVRMNCCRVRAKTLEDVIETVWAELAATSERQPTGNDQALRSVPTTDAARKKESQT